VHSMTQEQEQVLVVGGVDSHAETHHAAVLDQRGVLLGTRAFPVTAAGYRCLLGWLGGFGRVHAVAVESTSSYAAGLTRYLRERAVEVMEVNQPHAYTRRRRGKSDPVDAEMAARMYLAGQAKALPKQTDGIVESIRVLRIARNSAVKARSVALVQARDIIITAPQQLRERLAVRKTTRAKLTLCKHYRPAAGALSSPEQACKLALKTLARRVDSLEHEIHTLQQQLEPLVRAAAPTTTQLLGVSTGHAGQLLITAGQNIERLRAEGAFAALCGSNPIPASSGKTNRHRLNPGGDRQANRALHLIVVCRMRHCPRTQAYVQRRTQEGKTMREIIRCLKRYVAREAYHSLLADLTAPPHQPPRQTTTILCGNPGYGITRIRT
jgi:transposase